MVPSEGLTFIVMGNTQNLSRPFGLGIADVSVLMSPVALAFYKELVLDPSLRSQYPDIDWTAGSDAVAAQLTAIEDARLRELASGELWTMRKLYAGVGERDLVAELLSVHYRALPGMRRTSSDLHMVEPFGARPERPASIVLSAAEAARWAGRYALRAEDAGSGLPLEIEMIVDDGRIIAVPTADECQEFLAATPTRLVSTDDPDLFLVGEGAAGPFASGSVEYHGTVVGTYERVE